MALSAYRNLMRAAQVAFQGDQATLFAARQQIRHSFQEKATLAPNDPQLQPAIQHATDVAKFLRENLVQGQQQDNGKYKLRIHEDTERGDNDTIKLAGKGTTLGGGCCGGSGSKQ